MFFNQLFAKCYSYLHNVNPLHLIICFTIICVCMCVFRGKLIVTKVFAIDVLVVSLYFTLLIAITLLGREMHSVENSIQLLFSTYYTWLVDGKSWVVYEVVFNVLLFIPCGIIAYRSFAPVFRLVFVVGISVSIEIVQLFTGTGVCEVCDLIDNSLGGLIGILIYELAIRIKTVTFNSFRLENRK